MRGEGSLEAGSGRPVARLAGTRPGRVTRLLVLLIAAAGAAPGALGHGRAPDGSDPESLLVLAPEETSRFVDDVASRHGLEREAVRALLAGARRSPEVLAAFSRPAEARPWHVYRRIFLTPARIRGGVEFMLRNASLLEAAKARYGVPPRIVTAIIGVETLYGRRQGGIRVLDALATLAFFGPSRRAFFKRELEELLLLVREESLEPEALRGSYAGAMGIGQFIPSSYRHYAVDFDGDGRRDLAGSVADAIGNVASYLAAHGWERGAPIATPALIPGRLRPEGDASRPGASGGGSAGTGELAAILERFQGKGGEPVRPLRELAASGVRIPSDVPGDTPAVIMAFDAEQGREYWVGFRNFYVITRYNRSPLYALAVHQLADAIAAAAASASAPSGGSG